MSRDWTEDEIAALVDGSLEDGSRAAQLREILKSDPEAQAYAGRLRALNDALVQAFEAPIAEPVPTAIQSTIDGPRAANRNERRQPWIQMAMAASIALVIGLGFDRYFGQSDPGGVTTVGLVPQESDLHLALETLASGSGTEGGIFPILTFLDGAGRPCREFETTNQLADELLMGVACRADGDRWDVETIVTAPKGDSRSPGYAPASGPAADILNKVLDTLEAGPTLEPDVEAGLLKNRWSSAQ